MKTILYNPMSQGHLARSAEHKEYIPVDAQITKTINVPQEDGSIFSIEAGSNVLIRPTGKKVIKKEGTKEEKEAPVYEITTYAKGTSGLSPLQPEFWMRGFTPEKTVYISTNYPDKLFKFNKQHLLRHHGDLFPHEDSPSLEEIRQLLLPSCFLLSSIQSILSQPGGKAFIRGMMRENADNTITIRLFNESNETFEYITIDKSIVVNRLGPLNPHSAMWVFALEQAYAIMLQRTNQAGNAALSVAYSGGGSTETAIKVLTGLVSHTYDMPLHYYDFSSCLSSLINADLITTPQAFQKKLDATAFETLANYFNPDDPDAALNDMFNAYQYWKQDKAGYDKAVKTRTTKHIKDPTVQTILNNLFTSFPKTYTQEEENTFNTIKDSLKDGKIITASTPSKPMNKALSFMQTGLAVSHAYSVMGVFEKPMTIRNPDGTTRETMAKFIKVKNPWGRFGRVYRHNKETHDIQTGFDWNKDVFAVELRDFVNAFSYYRLSDSATALMHYDVLKEQCFKKICQTVYASPLSANSTIEELIAAHKAIKACETLILQLADSELELLDPDVRSVFDAIRTQHIDNEENFKQRITNLLETVGYIKYFYWLDPDIEAVTTRIYNLYRYKTATNEEPLLDIRANLIKTTQVPGHHLLEQHAAQIKAIMQQWVKQNEALFDTFDEKMQEITTNIRPFIEPKQPDDYEKLSKIIIEQKTALEKIYIQLEHENTIRQTLELPHFSEKLEILKAQLNDLNACTDDIDRIKNKKEELKDKIEQTLTDARELVEKTELTPESVEKLSIILQNLSHDTQENITFSEEEKAISDARALGQQFKTDTQKNVQNLGDSVINIADIAQEKLDIIMRINAFIQNLSEKVHNALNKLSLFFHTDNTYTIDLNNRSKPSI